MTQYVQYYSVQEGLVYILHIVSNILEKAYDIIDRHGMWQMLRVYGVVGKLLKAVQSFYVDSRACVRVEIDVSE